MGFFDRLFGRASKTTPAAPAAPSRRKDENLHLALEEDQEQEAYEILRDLDQAGDEAEQWAHSGQWTGMTSSNVAAAMYEEDLEQLTIEYHDGSYYQYQQVSLSEACDFHRAPSKGTWVWDNLRIRGTVFGHQKPYVFLSGPSAARRGWMRSAATRRQHGDIGPSGRNSQGNVIQPRDLHG